ncbi:MAG: hypothetical protein ACTSVI_08270 [Promethearchaeota archaeon]
MTDPEDNEEQKQELKELGLEKISDEGFHRLMEKQEKKEEKKPEFRGFK